MLRNATPEEIRNWDDLVWANPGGPSFFQLRSYADFKKPIWSPRWLVHDFGSDGVVPALYLSRWVPLLGEYWYCPSGPSLSDPDMFRATCKDLRDLKKPFAITMEPLIPVTSSEEVDQLVASIPGMADIPDVSLGNHTVFIDLTKTDDELLKSFRQRTRRALRQASDVVLDHRTDQDAADIMWHLYKEMLVRIKQERDETYVRRTWQRWIDDGHGHFILAKPKPDLDYQAGCFVLNRDGFGFYKDGGSLRTEYTNGLQYAVQWEAMKWCRDNGATRYDMFACPPSWAADDPTHKMHPLVQFKTGFAPISDFAGTMRLSLKPNATKWWDKAGMPIYRRITKPLNPHFY